MNEFLLSNKKKADSIYPSGLGGTWDINWPGSNLVTFSEGNLRVEVAGNRTTGSTNKIQTGNARYFEILVEPWPSSYGPLIGIVPPGGNYGVPGSITIWVGSGSGTQIFIGNAPAAAYGFPIIGGDIVGVLTDLEVTNRVTFFKNGTTMGTVDSVLTLPEYHAYTASPGGVYPYTAKANFGALPFM